MCAAKTDHRSNMYYYVLMQIYIYICIYEYCINKYIYIYMYVPSFHHSMRDWRCYKRQLKCTPQASRSSSCVFDLHPSDQKILHHRPWNITSPGDDRHLPWSRVLVAMWAHVQMNMRSSGNEQLRRSLPRIRRSTTLRPAQHAKLTASWMEWSQVTSCWRCAGSTVPSNTAWSFTKYSKLLSLAHFSRSDFEITHPVWVNLVQSNPRLKLLRDALSHLSSCSLPYHLEDPCLLRPNHKTHKTHRSRLLCTLRHLQFHMLAPAMIFILLLNNCINFTLQFE